MRSGGIGEWFGGRICPWADLKMQRLTAGRGCVREGEKREVNARCNAAFCVRQQKEVVDYLAKRKSCAMPILPEPVAKVLPVTAPICAMDRMRPYAPDMGSRGVRKVAVR